MGMKRSNPAGPSWVPKWRKRRLRLTPQNPPRPRIGGTLLVIGLPFDAFDRVNGLSKRQTLTRAEICRRCVSALLDEGDFGLDPIPGPFARADVTFPDDHYEMIRELASQVDRPISDVARCLIVQGLERYEASQFSPVA